MWSRLGGLSREAEFCGDFVDRKFLDVPQHRDLAVVRRQGSEGRREIAPKLGLGSMNEARIQCLFVDGGDQAGSAGESETFPACDAEQPSRKEAERPDGADVAGQDQDPQRLLGRVLGIRHGSAVARA